MSDLSSFEQQLKSKLSPPAELNPIKTRESENSLKSFEQQLKSSLNPDIQPGASPLPPPAPTPAQQNQPMGTRTMRVQKNLVLSFLSDVAGCGHIRNVFPMSFLNAVLGRGGQLLTVVCPLFITQQDLLARSRCLYFQRQMTRAHYNTMAKYKAFQPNLKYRMVYDIDDFIWGKNENQGGDIEDGVPSYNFGSDKISDEAKEWSAQIMHLMDVNCFSTQFLADYAKNTLKITPECVVLPNAIPKFFWGNQDKEDIQEPIKKPRVLYTGSPTHYHNVKRLKGDFNNAWYDWVIKAVKNKEITFICLGGLPWFFEDIKKDIIVENWVDSFSYHNLVKKQKADIAIMPLVRNNFNRGKSDIKAIEHYALGTPCIGSVFVDDSPSPYDNNPVTVPEDCTVDQIDEVVKNLCQPDMYNKIKNEQYRKMEDEGRYLESKKYVNHLVKILTGVRK